MITPFVLIPKESNNNMYWGESELFKKFEFPFTEFEKKFIFLKFIMKAHHYVVIKKENITSSRDPFQIRKAFKNAFHFFIRDVSDGIYSPYESENLLFPEGTNEKFDQMALDGIKKNIIEICSEEYIENFDQNKAEKKFKEYAETTPLIWSEKGLLDFLRPIVMQILFSCTNIRDFFNPDVKEYPFKKF